MISERAPRFEHSAASAIGERLRKDRTQAGPPRPTINVRRRGPKPGLLWVTDASRRAGCVRGERSGRLRGSNDLAVGVKPLDFDLLAAEFVPNRLDVVGANLLEPDFLDDSRGLVDQRVLGSLDDL